MSKRKRHAYERTPRCLFRTWRTYGETLKAFKVIVGARNMIIRCAWHDGSDQSSPYIDGEVLKEAMRNG